MTRCWRSPLEYRARRMTARDFLDWMDRCGLTTARAVELALGLGRNAAARHVGLCSRPETLGRIPEIIHVSPYRYRVYRSVPADVGFDRRELRRAGVMGKRKNPPRFLGRAKQHDVILSCFTLDALQALSCVDHAIRQILHCKLNGCCVSAPFIAWSTFKGDACREPPEAPDEQFDLCPCAPCVCDLPFLGAGSVGGMLRLRASHRPAA